jgi:gas vesicle protein
MSDWQQLLKTVAPMVGTALGGPFGGVAASFIADKLGIESKTVEAVTSVLSSGKMTPEQISQIKLAELDMTKFMADHQLKLEQLAVQNVQGARDMFVATNSLTPSILTWIIVAITLIAEGALLFSEIPPGADPIIVGRVLGTMDTALVMVLTFWFGSNSGSARTKELLAQASLK